MSATRARLVQVRGGVPSLPTGSQLGQPNRGLQPEGARTDPDIKYPVRPDPPRSVLQVEGDSDERTNAEGDRGGRAARQQHPQCTPRSASARQGRQ